MRGTTYTVLFDERGHMQLQKHDQTIIESDVPMQVVQGMALFAEGKIETVYLIGPQLYQTLQYGPNADVRAIQAMILGVLEAVQSKFLCIQK